MATWPATLPVPLQSGYSVAPVSAFIRTQMEGGPARQRKRFTAVPQMVTLTWRFTAAQMAIFKSFFTTDINLGADYFTMSLDVGSGMASHDCRFADSSAPYKPTALPGMNWEVAASIEVRNG